LPETGNNMGPRCKQKAFVFYSGCPSLTAPITNSVGVVLYPVIIKLACNLVISPNCVDDGNKYLNLMFQGPT
jgi:hypothetical protein